MEFQYLLVHCHSFTDCLLCEAFYKKTKMSDGWDDPYGSNKNPVGGWSSASAPNFFDPNANQGFGQEQHFQSFDYSSTNPSYTSNSIPPSGPSMFVPGPVNDIENMNEEDEPPLLEELGIDPDAILQKTLNVLNPRRNTDPAMLQDTDLAGPLVFCLAFGSFLLLAGKLQFGAIYGVGLLGCVALYGLLNLMSTNGVALGVVISVLGYCLLPVVALAGLNVLLSLQGLVGAILATTAIFWCSWSASKLFVTALSMHHQQPLVAYPCALVYSVFALITVF
ncbi:Yip1 domain [Trinorchestia longiramus]|nr:Yip1 domain [Trinorchestia longiramus]